MIYTSFDNNNQTWNAFRSCDDACLFYGNIGQLEEWLIDNKDKYTEH